MSVAARLRYRWRALVDSEALDAELDEELADHLQRQTDAFIAQGVAPGEAKRRARLEFGAVQRYKEEARDVRGLRWLEELRHDLRFALRMLARSPMFTTTVVVTLALGIGLSTAVFAVIDALLLRPLPGVVAPDELVQLYRTLPGGERFGSNSIPHVRDVRARSADVFTGVAAWSFTTMHVTIGDRPTKLFGVMASPDYFSVLGVQPALGRLFDASEATGTDAHPVAVLSHDTWQSHFGSDPGVIGRTLLVNGRRVEVIGVTRPDFGGVMPIVRPALFLPLTQLGQLRADAVSESENRSYAFLQLIARLRPEVSLAQARARMTAVIAELRARYPGDYANVGINLVPQAEAGIRPNMRTAQIGASAVVMTVVGLLLLVACVNVANLFIARAGARAREMAIRLALGARRGMLFRQLMVESLLFAGVSGIAGLLVAWGAIRLGNSITLPIDFDVRPDLQLSPTVLGFALCTTVLTALLFGLVPALQATHPSLTPALKGELPSGGSRSRISRVLVIVQMALSIMLLICAGLFAVNLRSASTIDTGFVSERLLTAELDPSTAGYTPERAAELYRQVMERVGALPTVQSVSMVDELPLSLNGSSTDVEIPGYTPARNESLSVLYAVAGAHYFTTMGTPLVRGREFTSADEHSTERVLIVNQRFADRFWPGQDPIGRIVTSGGTNFTVIGVVPTGKYGTLGESPRPHMWFRHRAASTFEMVLVIRTRGRPDDLIGPLRATIASIDPNLPLSNVRSMERHLGIALMPARLIGSALAVFGVLGLLLASVGMYGVVAYTVSQRTREIGIRMAIGASGQQVVRMILREGMALVLIGAAIGMVGALMGARVLKGLLYGNHADPIAFVVVPLVLVTVAALAMLIPARRAASVDPAITLRAE